MKNFNIPSANTKTLYTITEIHADKILNIRIEDLYVKVSTNYL